MTYKTKQPDTKVWLEVSEEGDVVTFDEDLMNELADEGNTLAVSVRAVLNYERGGLV